MKHLACGALARSTSASAVAKQLLAYGFACAHPAARSQRRFLQRSLLALVLAAPAFAAMDGPRQCASLVRLTDLSQAIEPGIFVEATDQLPAHCRVRGVINRAIRFEVTLPEDWNGRFMFSAVGGAAGVIGDVTSLLPEGFAMASTDTGHEAADGNAYLT